MIALSSRSLTLALLAALALPAQAGKFTYHGELMDADAPAEGAYDLRVRAFAHPGAKTALAEPTELPGVTLSQGRFSVELDIPEDVDGVTWVEVAVRRAGSGEAYETLGDPQPISKANSTCPGAWALDGNSGMPAGSFLGIAETSATPLVLKANNLNVARFTPYPPAAMGHGDAPSVALGSQSNVASGTGATVGGGGATKLADGSPCPHCKNTASGDFSNVGGGRINTASGDGSTVGGGENNTASQGLSTISGGWANQAAGAQSAVGGGFNNAARGLRGVIDGGALNEANGDYSTVGGGRENNAVGSYSVIDGGYGNTAKGNYSMVSGGNLNCAGGFYSWAGGRRAKVRPVSSSGIQGDGCFQVSASGDANGDEGSFVWADNQDTDFVSSGPNQFLVRAAGGLAVNTNLIDGVTDMVVAARPAGSDGDADADFLLKSRSGKQGSIYVRDSGGMLVMVAYSATGDTRYGFGVSTPTPGRYLDTSANGAHLTTGGTWTNGSSRAFKHAFETIDVSEVLARVVALPVSRWQYRESGEGVHLGPMAEDFAEAFGLGGSTQHISTVDADGVALAAIQGLNAKLEAENAALRSTLDALTARLARLEAARQE